MLLESKLEKYAFAWTVFLQDLAHYHKELFVIAPPSRYNFTVFKKVLLHIFLSAYIFLTTIAFIYTMSHKLVPGVPWPFVTHFYAMMAPFQNYTRHNAEVMAFGLTRQGAWEKISYKPYYPFERGETAIRIRMSSFADKTSKYRAFAKRIQELEALHGRVYQSVKLEWHKWEKSEFDYYGNYDPDSATKTHLARYDIGS